MEFKKIKHTTYVKGRVGWKGLTSDEFLERGYSYLVTGTDFIDGKVQWETCYHIDKDRYEEDPYIQLQEGDLLITKDGTIGKVALVKGLKGFACLNSGIFVIRPVTGDYVTEFMYWILVSNVFKEFNNYTSSGSTIKHLYQNVFVEFKFPTPEIEEQKAIAAFLAEKTAQIDQALEKTKQLISLLQEEKSAVINEAVTKGINPKAPMKDSGIEWIGEIPEHWEVKKLKYELKSLNNIRVPLSSEERGRMDIKEYDYYGASGVIDKVDEYLFDEDLILIGEDGANLLTRSKRLVFIATGKYWVNNHAHILKPIRGNLKYFSELLETYDFSVWVTGSAQPKLTSDNLANIPIIFPPIKEQNEITRYIESENTRINKEIELAQKEIELLKEYREALISEAVTGKIDVRDYPLN